MTSEIESPYAAVLKVTLFFFFNPSSSYISIPFQVRNILIILITCLLKYDYFLLSLQAKWPKMG